MTATVSSQRPAANGRSAAESVSMRRIASPPGAQVSAALRNERARRRGDAAIARAATSMTMADADRETAKAFDVDAKQ